MNMRIVAAASALALAALSFLVGYQLRPEPLAREWDSPSGSDLYEQLRQMLDLRLQKRYEM